MDAEQDYALEERARGMAMEMLVALSKVHNFIVTLDDGSLPIRIGGIQPLEREIRELLNKVKGGQ